MADCEDTESESSRVFDYTMLFDDVVGEILVKLDRSKRCEVVDELVEALDMAMLMDVRSKVFRFAKTKLVKSVAEPETMDLDPSYKRTLGNDTLGDAERMIDEWDLIARKGKPRVALDAVELLSYVSGNDPYFPHKVIKKRSKKAILKEKSLKTAPAKQALIPFKPVHEKDAEKDDDVSTSEESDSDSSENDTDEITEESELMNDDANANTGNENSNSENDGNDKNTAQDAEKLTPEVEISSEKHGEAEPQIEVNKAPALSQGGNLDTSAPKYNLPSVPKDPAKSPTATYIDWSEIVDLFTDANKETTSDTPNVTSAASTKRYANLEISKIVSINIPCTQPKHAQTAKPSQNVSDPQERQSPNVDTHTKPKKSASITMTTQTDWDMWGTPLASVNCPILKAPTCKCEHNARIFKEWKDDIERDRSTSEEQNRAKFNYLREQKMKSDEERERMKNTMAAMSKKLAENTDNIAELLRRTQKVGTDVNLRQKDQVSFHGWDNVESCPIDPFSPIQRPNVSSQMPGTTYPSTTMQCARVIEPRETRNEQSIDLTQSVHDDTIAQMNTALPRMNPNRDSRLQNSTVGRTPTVQRESQGDAPTGKTSGQNRSNDYNKRSNNTVARKPTFTPQQQRTIIVKSSGAGSSTRNTVRKENYRGGMPRQNEPWSDDPVSDAEMVSMAEASTSDNRVSSTAPPKGGNQSRTDILREAMVDSQLKDVRQKQQVKESIGSERYDKGGKRGREDSSGSDGANGKNSTYPNKANCKISVNEADAKKVLVNDFWPEYASARYWYTNNGNQQNRNGKSSDDDYNSDQ